VSNFAFEQSVKLSEREYINAAGLLDWHRRPRRMAIILGIAVLCLFSTYTLVLGLVLLLLSLLCVVMPRLLPMGAAATYRDSRYLQHELTFRATDLQLSVTSSELQCQCTWKNLKVWRERNGWLILSPDGMPQLLLSVQRLKDAGVYDAVVALARENASEFGELK
jgi:hypothetical protein